MDQNNMTIQQITILNWNANGVKRQKALLIDFLYRHQISIACITETHLIKTENFKISGYAIYRADRDAQHASGGVAILVKQKINHNEILLPNCQNLEIIGAQIKLNQSNPVNIISAYRQPNKKLLPHDLHSIFSATEATLLIGDLNSKNVFWGCRCNNPNGTLLNKIASENNLNVDAPPEYTYYPTRRNHLPDILDIVVSKNFNKTINQNVLTELDSDHLPVIIRWNNIPLFIPPPQKLIQGRIDWTNFKSSLDKKILPPTLKTIDEIDSQIDTYTENIAESIKMATHKPKHNYKKNIVKTPAYILDLIKNKSKLRREYQRTRQNTLKRKINKLTHQIKNELDKLRIEMYNKHIEQLQPTDPGMWKTTKKILSQPHTIAPIEVANRWYFTDIEKCEMFANHLETVFTPTVSTSPRHYNTVVNYIETHIPQISSIEPTSPKELKTIIRTLPLRKSPGPDLIPNIALKHLTSNFLAFLASLFNACMSLGYFPKKWKIAHILMFHKPGKKKNLVTSYRPISLLNTLAKLLEKVIYIRLQKEIEVNVLPAFQFGFRRKHSTIQQLLRITELIETGFENKEYTAMLFLDVAQAFDKVWLEGLKYKLLHLTLPPFLTSILFSFLENRKFSVKLNNYISSQKNIKAGVPQGSILGPALFNIFVRDIPTSTATLAMFADDTAIMTQNSELDLAIEELQTATNIIAAWFKKWNIVLNASKSESKIFGLKRIKNPINILLNDQVIEWNPKNKTVKYLGIHFDTRLTWSSHINSKLQLAYARLRQLYPLINRKSHLQVRCTILLYKSLLRPLLLYGCEVWGNTSSTNIRKLQTFQNKVLRIAVNAPWFIRNNQLHNELLVPPVYSFIKKITKNFLTNIPNCESAVNYNIGKRNIHKRLKRQLPQDIFVSDEEGANN